MKLLLATMFKKVPVRTTQQRDALQALRCADLFAELLKSPSRSARSKESLGFTHQKTNRERIPRPFPGTNSSMRKQRESQIPVGAPWPSTHKVPLVFLVVYGEHSNNYS